MGRRGLRVRVTWASASPEQTAARLAAALGGEPLAAPGQILVRLADDTIAVVRASERAGPDGREPDERLVSPNGGLEAVRSGGAQGARAHGTDADEPGSRARSCAWRLVALGWVTVEIDRLAAEHGLVAIPVGPDRLLGARCAAVEGTAVVLLEPDTEGRVAASLARGGEGPAVLYVAPDLSRDAAARIIDGRSVALAEAGLSASAIAAGPFGRSLVLGGGRAWGPHLVFCEGLPATPAPAASSRHAGPGP